MEKKDGLKDYHRYNGVDDMIHQPRRFRSLIKIVIIMTLTATALTLLIIYFKEIMDLLEDNI